jgi:hypothetical protein
MPETKLKIVVVEPFNGWWKGDKIAADQLTAEELEWHVTRKLLRVDAEPVDGEKDEDRATRVKSAFDALITEKKEVEVAAAKKAEEGSRARSEGESRKGCGRERSCGKAAAEKADADKKAADATATIDKGKKGAGAPPVTNVPLQSGNEGA